MCIDGWAVGGLPMSTRQHPLGKEEIERAFAESSDSKTGPILSPLQLAALLGLSRKTIYEWIASGRLDGAFRKRGKHNLIWRDRALKLIFNGPDWSSND
jgi:excisionase family DNA binding protein